MNEPNVGNINFELGKASKLNWWLTAQNRFRPVAIVQNNSNWLEPAVLGGQPPVEF